MAWTQGDIDALKAAMAQGVKSFEYRSGDVTRRQEFRSLAEMQQLLADMQAEVSGQDRSFAARRTVSGYDSGLENSRG